MCCDRLVRSVRGVNIAPNSHPRIVLLKNMYEKYVHKYGKRYTNSLQVWHHRDNCSSDISLHDRRQFFTLEDKRLQWGISHLPVHEFVCAASPSTRLFREAVRNPTVRRSKTIREETQLAGLARYHSHRDRFEPSFLCFTAEDLF